MSKLGIVLEEADESSFWIELLMEAGIITETILHSLYNESVELTKVFSVSRKTSKNNKVSNLKKQNNNE